MADVQPPSMRSSSASRPALSRSLRASRMASTLCSTGRRRNTEASCMTAICSLCRILPLAVAALLAGCEKQQPAPPPRRRKPSSKGSTRSSAPWATSWPRPAGCRPPTSRRTRSCSMRTPTSATSSASAGPIPHLPELANGDGTYRPSRPAGLDATAASGATVAGRLRLAVRRDAGAGHEAGSRGGGGGSGVAGPACGDGHLLRRAAACHRRHQSRASAAGWAAGARCCGRGRLARGACSC
jgi:hypothetical protein